MSFPLTSEEIQTRNRLRFEVGISNTILGAQNEHVVHNMLFNGGQYLSRLDG